MKHQIAFFKSPKKKKEVCLTLSLVMLTIDHMILMVIKVLRINIVSLQTHISINI
jgi:hypothetical protein